MITWKRVGLGLVFLLGLCAAAYWRAAGAAGQHAGIPDDTLAVQAAASAPGRIACLTFDDGPSDNTAAIADILAEYGAPATFFVTAQEQNLPHYGQLPALLAAGHQIALHSASHRYEQIYADPTSFWLDIKALRQALEPYVPAEDLTWLRFPGGSTNTVSHRYGGRQIMQRLKAEAEEKGYRWIDWNVCGEDATAAHPDAEAIFRNVRSTAEDKTVCIVLLHDTRACGETVKALPQILAWFEQEGYRFCTVEEMARLTDTPAPSPTPVPDPSAGGGGGG